MAIADLLAREDLANLAGTLVEMPAAEPVEEPAEEPVEELVDGCAERLVEAAEAAPTQEAEDLRRRLTRPVEDLDCEDTE